MLLVHEKIRTVVRVMALDPPLRGFESRGRRPGARWGGKRRKEIVERFGSVRWPEKATADAFAGVEKDIAAGRELQPKRNQ